MRLFQPKRVLIEPNALDYPLGRELTSKMEAAHIPVLQLGPANRVTGIPGATPQQKFREGKETLVIGVRKDLRLDTCKPSADFEFAIVSGCPGSCQYCYLQTHFGKKPYIKVYVNVDEILNKVRDEMTARLPEETTFEVASTADPLAVEHLTGSLAKTINFFGALDQAKLRVVTKFAAVDSLLQLKHNGHTRFRFSLNTASMVEHFEHHTALLEERIKAAAKIAEAGYPLGFIIAPLFIYPGYERDYNTLFQLLASSLKVIPDDLTFELITHRFTKTAKNVILERFPNTQLDLDESRRRRKFGRYGLVKYIYPEQEYAELKTNILKLLEETFPTARIEYFT